MQPIKLAKIGNGAKIHAGWAVLNANGTIHHIATDCNTYPGRTRARLVGEIANLDQITCPICRRCMERRADA